MVVLCGREVAQVWMCRCVVANLHSAALGFRVLHIGGYRLPSEVLGGRGGGGGGERRLAAALPAIPNIPVWFVHDAMPNAQVHHRDRCGEAGSSAFSRVAITIYNTSTGD